MAQAEVSQVGAGEVISPRRRSRAASLESMLGTLVEIPAALLVVAEIVILFAGVVARYGLRSPLIWSDELASILFLWLAMLGAAVAFRRSEHMRMTAIIASARPAMRAYLDVVATCAALAFLLLIVGPSWDYAYEESFITTPALQIPNIWRAAALPVGVCLMALFAFLRLARTSDIKVVLAAVLSVAAIIAVFWLAQPWLRPLGNINLVNLLCRRRRFLRIRGRADRVWIWPRHLRLSGADHAYAADGADRPDGRGHEPPDPAGGAAVRVPGPADRDDRHGPRHGGVPGQPAWTCQRWAALRAGRRDVSGVGHLRLQGRRHGRGGAGAVSRDEGARRQARRSRRAAGGHRRPDRNHSAESRSDHHRFGDRGFDLGAVYRRPVAGRGAGDHAVGAGVVALSRRGSQPCHQGQARRDCQGIRHRPARIGAAVRDPLRRGRGHRHRHRSFHHRHRLRLSRRLIGLSPVRLVAG